MVALARLLALCGLLALPVGSAVAAPADLDRSFGGDGVVAVERPSGAAFSTQVPAHMALGLDDEIFVLYSTVGSCPSFSSCPIEWSLLRYDRDGNQDTGFGNGAQASLSVLGIPYLQADLAVGPDGKPVVAAADQGGVVVARFDRQGNLDASFGSGGVANGKLEGTAGTPPAVTVQADGKVVVAAEGSSESVASGLILARYLADGNPDPGFGQGGRTAVKLNTQSRPADLLPSQGGITSVGLSECCRGEGGYGPGLTFARFLDNGSPDGAFAGQGSLLLPTPDPSALRALAAAPDGGIFAALDEEVRGAVIVKLLPDGSYDRGFGRGGEVVPSRRVGVIGNSDIALDAQARLVGVGWAGSGVWAFRLRPDGGADRTFNGGQGVRAEIGGAQETAADVGLQSSGRIVALGESTCCGPKAFALVGLRGGTDRTRCLGKKATIVGTRGRDELTGTPRRDVIAALQGADKVRGLGGADLICGGKGKDLLYGGAGRDRVRQ